MQQCLASWGDHVLRLFYRPFVKENSSHVRLSRRRLAGRPLQSVNSARRAPQDIRAGKALNRGVSVAEIAARVGVSEKRMRAVIRDPRTAIRGLAPPHAGAARGVLALQVSRLNEALLATYSAMGGMNLA